MKATALWVLCVLAATGCTTLGPVQANSRNTGSDGQGGSAFPAAPDPFPAADQNSLPRLIIPAIGGPPVIGIPVGGNLYVPVTGGPPVTGIPTGP